MEIDWSLANAALPLDTFLEQLTRTGFARNKPQPAVLQSGGASTGFFCHCVRAHIAREEWPVPVLRPACSPIRKATFRCVDGNLGELLKKGIFAWRVVEPGTFHNPQPGHATILQLPIAASMTIYGNVADATHGQRHAGQVLATVMRLARGFRLRSASRHLPTFSAPTAAGATSTLGHQRVAQVNELQWTELDDFARRAGPNQCAPL